MKRTLLAVGVAVLASLMYIPENHGAHFHVPIIFPGHYGVEWGSTDRANDLSRRPCRCDRQSVCTQAKKVNARSLTRWRSLGSGITELFIRIHNETLSVVGDEGF